MPSIICPITIFTKLSLKFSSVEDPTNKSARNDKKIEVMIVTLRSTLAGTNCTNKDPTVYVAANAVKNQPIYSVDK